jgi:hypothetical protein
MKLDRIIPRLNKYVYLRGNKKICRKFSILRHTYAPGILFKVCRSELQIHRVLENDSTAHGHCQAAGGAQGNADFCYTSCHRPGTPACDPEGCDWTTCVDDVGFVVAPAARFGAPGTVSGPLVPIY